MTISFEYRVLQNYGSFISPQEFWTSGDISPKLIVTKSNVTLKFFKYLTYKKLLLCNAVFCGISSGSSLFASHIYESSVYKRLIVLILNVPSTIFQLNRVGSSWFEPVLSWDKCLEPTAPRSRVKHSTTEPLQSQGK